MNTTAQMGWLMADAICLILWMVTIWAVVETLAGMLQ